MHKLMGYSPGEDVTFTMYLVLCFKVYSYALIVLWQHCNTCTYEYCILSNIPSHVHVNTIHIAIYSYPEKGHSVLTHVSTKNKSVHVVQTEKKIIASL